MEQRENQQPIDAEISRERAMDEFEIITDPEQRKALAECADILIERIVAEKFDCLVFLDQSARPIHWLLRARFKWLKNTKQGIFADDNTRRTAMFPKIKFINFGPEDKNDVLYNNKKQDMTPQLKKIFQKTEDTSKTYFDNKKTLIVDEYSPGLYLSHDGSVKMTTVEAARQVFCEAFAGQNAKFFGMVFISKEKHIPFLKTGGVPWRDPSDIYQGITGISERMRKKRFLSRPYRQIYPSLREDLEQTELKVLNTVPDIISQPRIKNLKDQLPILSMIKNQYNSLRSSQNPNFLL